MTIYFAKGIMEGKIKYVRADMVKICFAPMYSELSVKAILEEAFKHEGVRAYFPEDRDLHRLPRDWCLNVAYSVIGAPFKAWVDRMCE